MEKAVERQRVLLQHLNPNSVTSSHHSTHLSASLCSAGQTGGSENDVVIVAAYRTAICKAKRGGFKDTLPDDLLASVLKAVIEKTNVEPSEVGDIVVGTVLGPGSERAIECRMAAFYAGFPDTVPLRTVNRQCSSGLQAVADVAAYIKAGFYDIGIGAGLECMTQDTISGVRKTNPKVEIFAQARDCLLSMGITSENVAQRYGVTRQEQDQAAVESHRRAAAATASGKFKDEIIPVSTKFVDPKTGEEKQIIVSVDDGIRPNANLVDLAKLKPAFKKDGTTTAGNASQVSDGAAAVLLMKRSVAVQKGLPILGIFRSFAAVGVDPAVMGVGPAFAIPAAVKSAGLELSNIDLYEINEAFASQFVYSCKKLGLDPTKVNVNGGAMAFAQTPPSDSDPSEPTATGEGFDDRINQLRIRYKRGTGKKAEIRKSKKSNKAASGSGPGSGVYLPPVPLKEPVSGGLKVELGFSRYSERLNGRIALLGLTALLLVELATGKGVINYHTPGTVIIQLYFMASVTAIYVKLEKEKISVWPDNSSSNN